MVRENVIQTITSMMSNSVTVYSLDFSKASDSVRHCILSSVSMPNLIFQTLLHTSFITPKQQNIKAHKIEVQSNTNQNIKL